jgi:hypothetical protein
MSFFESRRNDLESSRPGPTVALIRMSFHVSARHGGLKESIIVARLRKSDINFLWLQLEDVIEHGKNKDVKTKLELMRRIYQFLAKTISENKPARKR